MNKRKINSLLILLVLFGMTFLVSITFSNSNTIKDSSIFSLERIDPFTNIGKNAILDDVTEIGQLDENYGRFRGLFVKGSVAFVAGGLNGLIAVNISNPSSPAFLGQCELPGIQICNYADFEEDVAVISCSYDGVVTVNISDPTNMYILDRYDTTQSVSEIIVENNIVYAAYSFSGLVILNISNPSVITFEGSYYSGSGQIQQVEKSGSYIITYNYDGYNVSIINAADVTNPSYVSSYSPGSSVNDMALKNNSLYLFLSSGYTYIIDLSIIASPSYSSQFTRLCSRALVEDDILYIGISDRVYFYNVSNPASPVYITTYQEESIDVYHLFLNDTTLVISQLQEGLLLLDVTDVTTTTILGEFEYYGSVYSVITDNNFAYMASQNGFLIADVTDIANPSYIYKNDTDVSNRVYDIAFYDKYVVTMFGQDLRIFDVSDPYNVEFISSTSMGSQVFDIEVAGNFAYLASTSYGLMIVNLTDVNSPIIASTLDDGPVVYDVFVNGNYVYAVKDYNGFSIINATDPLNPDNIQNITQSGAIKSICGSGNFIFTGNNNNGIKVYNATTIDSTYEIDSVSISPYAQNRHIETEGNYLYLTRDGFGVLVFNWTDPTNVVQCGEYYDDDGEAEGLAFNDGTVFIADGSGGLEIIKLDTDGDMLSNYEEEEIYDTNPVHGDTDGDTIGDYDEIFTFFTDPLLADTDSDGLDDLEELTAGADGFITDPQDSDSDDDGLNDGDEYTHGSDPNDADSDDDGLTDDVEASLGTDPNDIDSDNDLLGDYEEVIDFGTDPLDTDTDDDGIDDFEETVPGSDGFITDPTDADTDGDGIDDDVEIAAGTDPTDPDDPPTTTPSPTDTSGIKNGIIFGFSMMSLISMLIWITNRRRK